MKLTGYADRAGMAIAIQHPHEGASNGPPDRYSGRIHLCACDQGMAAGEGGVFGGAITIDELVTHRQLIQEPLHCAGS